MFQRRLQQPAAAEAGGTDRLHQLRREVRSGQVRSGQVRSGQVRSGQVRSALASAIRHQPDGATPSTAYSGRAHRNGPH